MNKPRLEEYKTPERLSEYPQATCFKSGHLVTKNAGWRNRRPVVDSEKCKGCLQCYLYCPDGVISKKTKEGSSTVKVSIDYDFCKGCGICAKVCKLKAIRMEAEHNE